MKGSFNTNQQHNNYDNEGIETLPSVAIVILNWNGQHFLERFLPSVIASTYANKK